MPTDPSTYSLDRLLYDLRTSVAEWAKELHTSTWVRGHLDDFEPPDFEYWLRSRTKTDLQRAVSVLEITKGRDAGAALAKRFHDLYSAASAYEAELEKLEKDLLEKTRRVAFEYKTKYGDEAMDALAAACQGPDRVFELRLPRETPLQTAEDYAQKIDLAWSDEKYRKAHAKCLLQKHATELVEYLEAMELYCVSYANAAQINAEVTPADAENNAAVPIAPARNKSRKRKCGRSRLEPAKRQEYKALVADWEKARKSGEKKQSFCNDRGIKTKYLNAAIQYVRALRKRKADRKTPSSAL